MYGHLKYVKEAQLNTNHCCRHYSAKKYFKSVQHTVVSSLFKNCVYALGEEERLLDYIQRDKWPLEVPELHDNLLQTANLDDKSSRNHGND